MNPFNYCRRELKRLSGIGAIHWSMISQGRKQLAEEILELEPVEVKNPVLKRKRKKDKRQK